MHSCLESASLSVKYTGPTPTSLILFLGLLKCMVKNQKQKQKQISREEIEEGSQVASQIFYFVF